MNKKLITRITLRNDTTEKWQKVEDSVILLQGEIALEYAPSGVKIKIGDGYSTWKNLPYFAAEPSTSPEPIIPELPENYTWGMLFGITNSEEETEETDFLHLTKPSYNDLVDVKVLNANSDLIEQEIIDIDQTITSLVERLVALEENKTPIIDPELEQKVENNRVEIENIKNTLEEQDKNLTDFYSEINNKIAETEELVNAQNEKISEQELLVQQNKEDVEANTSLVEELNQKNAANEELIRTIGEKVEETAGLNDRIVETENRLNNLIQYTTENADEFDEQEIIDARLGVEGITYNTLGEHVRVLGDRIKFIEENTTDLLGGKLVDGLSYNNFMLQLTADGTPIGNAVEIRGGTGGGAISSYEITLTNLLDSRIISVAKGEEVNLEFKYSSTDEEGFNDGNGIGSIYVNEVKKLTFSAIQGDNTCNITNYLSNGTNVVKLTVENSEGAYKTIVYTITVIALAVTTTVSNMDLYTGAVSFPYIVTGSGLKTVHFIMDEYEMGTETIASTESSRTFNIPAQPDGAHILTVYAEVENEGLVLKSNVLKIGMMWYSSTMTDQAVLINYDKKETIQGETLTIPYLCYDPFSQNMEITLNIYEGETLYSSKTITVDQTPKTWVTQDYPIGATKFEIINGNAAESIIINVAQSDFDREVLSDSRILEFTAAGRSNDEPNPEYWEQNGYAATFSGFGWSGADGWVEDDNGQTVLRFLPGNEMTIPFMPFATDFRNSGFTIEAEFASHNVRDYETVIATSYSGERGFIIRSQSAELASEQTKVSTQFREDTKVRITFVVEQKNLNRFIYTYINGVMCDVAQYPESDNFGQSNPVGLTIGAEACGLDLYVLRFYSKGLTRQEQLNNYICDRASLAERKEIDERNDIFDENSEITVATLPMNIPYMILECEELPQFKGDKKKGKSVTFIDPMHPERNFTAAGVQLDVQGTSSQGYPIKNYKASLKSGLTYTNSGKYSDGFAMPGNDLLCKNFCLKADFASSENANNVMLVDYYENLVPFKTPPQENDERVRTGIRGFAGVVFWQNTETGEVKFIGKYNINDDKSNENVFGFDRDIYPNCECWEVCNNTSNRVIFKESEYEETITVTKPDGSSETYPAWYDDFEARFPDLDEPFRDNTNLKRLTDWLVSTDRDAVDSEEEKAARLEKFKNEFEDYFIKDPCIFYYLFTEVFLMVDSRAKNMFLTTFDGTHWFPIPYDMDTALGIR